MTKLTPRTVAAATPAKKGDLVIFDEETAGFGLKVTPLGTKVFFFQYWSPVDKAKRTRRRVTIGRLGETMRQANGATVAITPHTARVEAERLRGIVRDHRDPFLEREQAARAEETRLRTERAAVASQRAVRTIAEEQLVDLADRSPRTVREYRRLLDKHLLEVRTVDDVPLGDRPIAEVGKDDVHVVRRQRALAGRPVLANRVQQLGRSLLNYAERIGARPEGRANPFAGERWHAEEETREALTREEVQALQQALDAEDTGMRGGAVDAIRFLLYSGWRKGEALALRWDAIELETGMATLGRTKSGRSTRPLSRQALDVLAAIPRRGPHVFPSERLPGRPLAEIKRTWIRVRAAAGITKPMHSLRHTVASVALSEGVPIAAVGSILGHKNTATTARYAKMEHAAARAAADTVGAALGRTASTTDVLSFVRPKKARK